MTGSGVAQRPRLRAGSPNRSWSPLLVYHLLDWFFWVFHTVLVGFNLFGWIPRRTRRWNLATLALTAFSWFVLGIWYGWGYCLCTDWHWQVRRHLGYTDDSPTYIHLLLWKLTGINFSVGVVEWITGVGFALSLIASVAMNVTDRRRRVATV